jgi:hypothetical protein
MAKDYPGQVSCIFLRNTSATDPSNKFPYDTSGFEGLKQQTHMFFRVPEDLTDLDISNGRCLNSSIPQNLTFGFQGLPFGIGDSSSEENAAIGLIGVAVKGRWSVVAFVGVVTLLVLGLP